MSKFEFRVSEASAGLRLDQCLGRSIEGLSRGNARVALELGAVFVDNKRVKIASRRVRLGEHIAVHLGGAFERAKKQLGQAARQSDQAALPAYAILLEDEHIVVVNKPAGLLSAPTPEGDSGNLQALLSRRERPARPVFVVHRLDLHTSGVMVFAKSQLANQRLSEMFQRHALTRRYDALASGPRVPESFSIKQPLGGKPAITHFRLLRQYAEFCHVEATLETGRTHQIRRHLRSRSLSILADVKYGGREPWHPARLGLHAKHLGFEHPVSAAPLSFDVELPEDLRSWLFSRDTGQAPPISASG